MQTDLIVLDYAEGKVFVYRNIDNQDNEGFEDFITSHGHNLSSCEWMASPELEINELQNTRPN